jgi:hypothetical protein
MKGYKVVSRTGDKRLWSAVFGGECGREYFPGRFIRAHHIMERKGFGLTFFEDFRKAVRFADHNTGLATDRGKLEVWVVEAEGVFKRLPRVRVFDFNSAPPTLTYFSYLVKSFMKKGSVGDWPWGTRMARRISLVRKVR